MKKAALTLLIFTLFAVSTSAVIDEVSIVNFFPDEESTVRQTQLVGRFDADATTTATAQVWVQTPNGSTIKDGQQAITVKKGAPLERTFVLKSQFFEDFGEYQVILNQTNNNIDDSFSFTIRPRPVVDIRVGDLVKQPDDEDLDYIHVNVNPNIGRDLSFDDFQNETVKLFRIDDDQSGPDVNKTLVIEQDLLPAPETTNDLEAVIDLTQEEEGSYEVFVSFNISTCPSCPSFPEVEATSLRVRNDSVSNMSSQLGVVLSLLFAGFLFAFIGSRIDTTSQLAAVLRVFLFMLAPVFAVFAVFTGGHFARVSGFTAVGQYMNLVFLGTFFAWFFFIFVVGVLMYFNQDFKNSVQSMMTGRERVERV